jgi:hypothetical protein
MALGAVHRRDVLLGFIAMQMIRQRWPWLQK